MKPDSAPPAAPNLPPEAATLLASLRVDWTDEAQATLTALANAVTDWPRVLEWAQHHTVIPLCYQKLSGLGDILPASAQAELRQEARSNAAFALLMTGELCQLLELFAAHGIPALPYKGPALAAEFYGSPAQRQFRDLDVLVRPADLPRARALLHEHGWHTEESYQGAREQAFVRHYDSFKYFRANVLLELHWRVTERRFVFPLSVDELLTRAGSLTLQGRRVMVSSVEDTLLVICFHGAQHLWERLSWLCDVAQLLATRPALDWDKLLSRTKMLGCERVLWLSLRLARDYLHAPVPEHIARRLETDDAAQALAKQAAGRWFASQEWSNSERARRHAGTPARQLALPLALRLPHHARRLGRLPLRLATQTVFPLLAGTDAPAGT
jgi:hypothetical protein